MIRIGKNARYFEVLMAIRLPGETRRRFFEVVAVAATAPRAVELARLVHADGEVLRVEPRYYDVRVVIDDEEMTALSPGGRDDV